MKKFPGPSRQVGIWYNRNLLRWLISNDTLVSGKWRTAGGAGPGPFFQERLPNQIWSHSISMSSNICSDMILDGLCLLPIVTSCPYPFNNSSPNENGGGQEAHGWIWPTTMVGSDISTSQALPSALRAHCSRNNDNCMASVHWWKNSIWSVWHSGLVFFPDTI